MKILHLSTYDFDAGASRAAYRLHRALLTAGISSRMLVSVKSSYDATVIGPRTRFERGVNLLFPQIDRLPLDMFPQRHGTWSTSLFPNRILKKVAQQKPDLIHLHWVGFGFMPLRALSRLGKPILWTMHDMWPFTGGCHYAADCTRFSDHCGCCPLLGSRCKYDVTYFIMQRKLKHWKDLDMIVVSPSKWLASKATASSLFSRYRIEVVPNLLDLGVYKPVEKKTARKLLNLPEDKKLILFVAINAHHEPRKGYDQLLLGLRKLAETYAGQNLMLLVVGTGEPEQAVDMPFDTRYLGRLHDDLSMSLVYSAADVFVAPSLQDNLPNTVMEALACGTPCVAFAIGGIPDMVSHMVNGYLAEPHDPYSLAKGIALLIEDEELNGRLSKQARNCIEKSFDPHMITNKYVNLYRNLLAHQVD